MTAMPATKKRVLQQSLQHTSPHDQLCKVHMQQLGVPSLTQQPSSHLFLKEKRLCEHLLASTGVWDFDTHIAPVPVEVVDAFEISYLALLGSQTIQKAIKPKIWLSDTQRKVSQKVGALN